MSPGQLRYSEQPSLGTDLHSRIYIRHVDVRPQLCSHLLRPSSLTHIKESTVETDIFMTMKKGLTPSDSFSYYVQYTPRILLRRQGYGRDIHS